jgi:predicted nucleotide-binding protein
LDFTPVILHEQPDSGRTVFDKLETELADVGFAFVLLSPDDFGGVQGSEKKSRARQNVIFEHGLLVGRLGAQRVCAVVKSDVELPSDLHGVLYKHLPMGTSSVQSIALDLILELKAAGYEVDANRILGAQQLRSSRSATS